MPKRKTTQPTAPQATAPRQAVPEQATYAFRAYPHRPGEIHHHDPHFIVTFSNDSVITYRDKHNNRPVPITAAYTPGQPIHAFTDPLTDRLQVIPTGHTPATYTQLIEDRIHAAARHTGHPGVTYFHPQRTH